MIPITNKKLTYILLEMIQVSESLIKEFKNQFLLKDKINTPSQPLRIKINNKVHIKVKNRRKWFKIENNQIG